MSKEIIKQENCEMACAMQYENLVVRKKDVKDKSFEKVCLQLR